MIKHVMDGPEQESSIPTDKQVQEILQMSQEFVNYLEDISSGRVINREFSIAIQKIQEACMWATLKE